MYECDCMLGLSDISEVGGRFGGKYECDCMLGLLRSICNTSVGISWVGRSEKFCSWRECIIPVWCICAPAPPFTVWLELMVKIGVEPRVVEVAVDKTVAAADTELIPTFAVVLVSAAGPTPASPITVEPGRRGGCQILRLARAEVEMLSRGT
jgi:hypothetical protein